MPETFIQNYHYNEVLSPSFVGFLSRLKKDFTDIKSSVPDWLFGSQMHTCEVLGLQSSQEIFSALWYRKSDDFYEIDYIASLASKQRKGHAKFLLKHLIFLAQKSSAKGIWLEVAQSNEVAQAFYCSLGFVRQEGLRKNYYGPGQNACNYSLEWGR